MVNYVVAIPTYNRADIVANKTLKTLIEGNINKNRIYLFVANKSQYKLYEESVPKTMYKEIIIGKIGITNQRKFISKFFPENQYIISIDDDVEELLSLRGTDKLVKVKDVDKFFNDAYKLLKKEKLYIWGIYPVRNAFFMKPTITTHLRFIIGVLYGYINRHNKKLEPNIASETKEDYEQSILYYKMDGGVIRFNNITTKTKFNAEGGLGSDRINRSKTAAEYLKKTYPEIITIFRRDNGVTEVKFAKMPRYQV